MKNLLMNNMKTLILSITFLIACTIIYGQGKVDFSGKWKINKSKSTLNEQYSSAPKTLSIIQEDNSMSIERVSERRGQEYTATDKYTLDGKESRNPGFRNSVSVSTANWSPDGKSLRIFSKISTDNGEMTMDRNLKMDGENLIIDFTINGPWGESKETWVFDKQ